MRLPFGLDLKTVIVTVLFLLFVLPWVMGQFQKRSGNSNGG